MTQEGRELAVLVVTVGLITAFLGSCQAEVPVSAATHLEVKLSAGMNNIWPTGSSLSATSASQQNVVAVVAKFQGSCRRLREQIASLGHVL